MEKENRLLKTDLSKRVYGLDILRAYAILVVLYIHTYDLIQFEVFKFITYICFDGVTVFFVLSGFLIGRILIRTVSDPNVNRMSLIKFWINRWMRTLPPYFVALIIIFAIAYGFNLGIKPDYLGIKKQLAYFFFLQNLDWPHFQFYPESWSLSVEEWFYLIVPLIIFSSLLIFKRKPKTSILITIITVIVLVTLYRYIKYVNLGYDTVTQYQALYIFNTNEVIIRLDSLIYGVLGAFLAHYYSDFWIKYRKYAFSIGIILAIVIRNFYLFIPYTPLINTLHNVFYYTIASVAVAFLLPYLSLLKNGSGILYKALTYVSLISYSLYLLHFTFVKFCIIEPLTRDLDFAYLNNFKFILIWGLSFLLATLMYLYVEKPSMDLRKKIKLLKT